MSHHQMMKEGASLCFLLLCIAAIDDLDFVIKFWNYLSRSIMLYISGALGINQ
jgi:hypothetical protein